ncbi:hypothetical protein D3C87_76600 [compost metagenome]
MIDIYCKDDCCPICNSKLERIFAHNCNMRECKTGCYLISKRSNHIGGHLYVIKIVGGLRFGFFNTNEDLIEIEKTIISKIEYLRENDRYIGEILVRGKV